MNSKFSGESKGGQNNKVLETLRNQKSVFLYSCTKNMHSILNNHNRRLLDELNRNSGGPDVASWKCRSKGECPLGRRCNSKNVVYQVCISPMEHNNDGERVYIDISTGNWKQGRYNHIYIGFSGFFSFFFYTHIDCNPYLLFFNLKLNMYGPLMRKRA